MYPFDDQQFDPEYFRKQNALRGVYPDAQDDAAGSGYNDYAPLPSVYPPNINASGMPPAQQAPQFPSSVFQPQQQSDLPEIAPDDIDWEARYRKLYHPQSQAQDRLNELLNNFPQEKGPSFGRTLLAIGAGIGKNDMAAGQKVLDEPYNTELAKWKTQAEPFEKAAENERQGNVNERYIAQQTMAAEQNQQRLNEAERKNRETARITEKKNTDTAEIARKKNELVEAKQNGTNFNFKGKYVIATNPDGTAYNTGIETTNFDPMEKARLESQTKLGVANIGARSREKVANIGAASREIFNMPDPDDPTRQISGVMDPATGHAKPFLLDGQKVGPIGKPLSGAAGAGGPATKFTNQTQAIMEGAKMLLPSVTDVRKMAVELDNRGMFGPVMSRVRDMAAKVGTTGDPEQVQRNWEDLAYAMHDNDTLNPENDPLVGDFLASLGFLSSGTGRVHGGAKGGGSIAMINYMKSLLNSDSTIGMFNGRLNALERLMNHYAVGPNGSVTTQKTTLTPKAQKSLDSILNDVLGKPPEGDD